MPTLTFVEHAAGLAVADTDVRDIDPAAHRQALRDVRWQPASVMDPDLGIIAGTGYREASVIGPRENPSLIFTYEEQARKLVFPYISSLGPFEGLELSGSQIVKYEPGGFFKPHRDSGGAFRNRCFTILAYLSECKGGATLFPEVNVVIRPKVGRWLVFYSEYLHSGELIESGTKNIFVTWAVRN